MNPSKPNNNNESTAGERKRGWKRFLEPYRLVLLNDQTYDESFSLRMSRINMLALAGAVLLIAAVIAVLIILATPLREYVSGNNGGVDNSDVAELKVKTDSLEADIQEKNLYLENIRRIMAGEKSMNSAVQQPEIRTGTTPEENTRGNTPSKEDLQFRKEYEEGMRNTANTPVAVKSANGTEEQQVILFSPVKGIVTNPFNGAHGHFGTDIVTRRNEVVKSSLSGTVILAEWTAGTGHVIMVQHTSNLITVYKHNAVLLKKQGDLVKAGESIAIVGDSGELSTGPHLHYELWIDGKPVNAENYITF